MLLMFSSAIDRADIPLIQYTATRLVLLGGESVLLRFVACRLERAASLFFAWSVG